MLVLSRKLNQSIQVGENISITIVRVKGNVVQLGIVAPRQVPVVRSELIERDARQTAERNQCSPVPGAGTQPVSGETDDAPQADRGTSIKLLAAS